MSATNATTNYELPVFIATDKPAWLVDWNGAMNTIDSAIKEAKTAGDNAQSTANTNANNIQTLDGTVTSQGTAIGNLQTAVSGNTGSINTINSLIGNGEPTTTDKTIIGAINEINAQVQSPEADDVAYTNTTSGLSATNVQDAIDEIDALVGSGTLDTTAQTLVGAVNELVAGGGGGGAEHGVYELWANADVTQSFAGQNIVLTDFDASKYDAIIIAVEEKAGERFGADWHEFDKDVLDVPSYSGSMIAFSISNSSGTITSYYRSVEFSLSGSTLTITLSDCTKGILSTYGSAATTSTDNEWMIPVRVLGLTHNS